MARVTNQTAIAGEFAVLSQLALHGFDANLTLGNTKGVDILVSDPETKIFARVEVKTARYQEAHESLFGQGKFIPWLLTEKAEVLEYDNLFYCFVAIADDNTFRFFVVPGADVATYIAAGHKLWLDVKERGPNALRKFRLALDSSEFKIPTLRASDYENRWDLIRATSK